MDIPTEVNEISNEVRDEAPSNEVRKIEDIVSNEIDNMSDDESDDEMDLSRIVNPLRENIPDEPIQAVQEKNEVPKEVQNNVPNFVREREPIIPEKQYEYNNPLSIQENEERQNVIKKINLYYQHFKDELKGIRKPRGMSGLTKEELEDFLKKIDGVVSGSASHDLIKNAYYTAVSTTEMVGLAYTPLKLQGWSNAVANSPYIDKQLKRLEIKYMEDLNAVSEPETALLSATVLTALAVHRANVSIEKDVDRMDINTNEINQLNEDYKDL